MYCQYREKKRFCSVVVSIILATLLAGCASSEQKESSHAHAAIAPLLIQAVAERQSGHLGKAESALNRAIRIVPTSPDVYYQMALLRELQGHNDQARQLAKRALGLNPGYHLEQKIEFFLSGLSI